MSCGDTRCAGCSTNGPARWRCNRWRDFDVERYPHEPLLGRVWQLRANVSAYDAVYVALAEALSTVLVTGDRRLAAVPGLAVAIEPV